MRLALLLLALSIPAFAQNDCDLGQVTDSTPLIYPPIARAAHVSDTIIMMVRFKANGEPEHIEVLSGAVMLRESATKYVQGWKAAEYPGTRNCPTAISYFIDSSLSSAEKDIVGRIDAQHVFVTTYSWSTADYSSSLSRWQRFKLSLRHIFHLSR